MTRTTELRLHCPDIHALVDAIVAKEALAISPGIDLVEVDYQTAEVRLLTSNQDGGIDAQQRLVDAGYPPDTVHQRILSAGPEGYENTAVTSEPTSLQPR